MRFAVFVIVWTVVNLPMVYAASNLFLFRRQFEVLPDDCAKTYKIDFSTQGSCEVELWPQDSLDVQFEPSRLIYFWRYTDDDLELFVTTERTTAGYLIRVNVNSDKYSDRLPYAVSEKYIRAALEDGKIQFVTTLVGLMNKSTRGPKAKYTEQYIGPLNVYERRVDLTSPSVFEACKAKWRGFQCVFSFLRNQKGETLLHEVAKATVRHEGLTLDLRSQPAWQNGSAFSALTLTISSDRFIADLSKKRMQFSVLVKNLRPLRFLVTQVEGDDASDAVYSQIFKARLQAVREFIVLDKDACALNYVYVKEKFKGGCEVARAWSGLLAQPASVFSRFLNVGVRWSLVDVAITPKGYRIDFSGTPESVGAFSEAEPFYDELERVMRGEPRSIVFFVY